MAQILLAVYMRFPTILETICDGLAFVLAARSWPDDIAEQAQAAHQLWPLCESPALKVLRLAQRAVRKPGSWEKVGVSAVLQGFVLSGEKWVRVRSCSG